MDKRGQITVFIILSLLIVAIVALIFLFIKPPKETPGVYTASIYNFVDECIQETAEDAIYEIGQNGGYYFPANISTPTGIAYYYENGRNLIPKKERVEEQISLYIKENLFFCTKNFVQFTNYNISQREINVETTISNDKVILEINYPIIISQGEESAIIEDFEKEINVRIGLIYSSIIEFLNYSKQEICLSCLFDISETNDLIVEMVDYDNKTVIFIFRDENSKLNEQPFEWVFANKY